MSNNNTPKKELEQQYQREYNRIKQAINRQKKLGYIVPEEIIPLPPSKVKNITPEHVERLVELTPKKIRKSSVYVDPQSGEAFEDSDVVNSHHVGKQSQAKVGESATQPHQKRKIKKSTPSKQTSTEQEYTAPPKDNNLNMQIIEDITEMLETWAPASYWTTSYAAMKSTYRTAIYDKWMQAINNEGAYQLAYRLENNAMLYHRMIDRVIHFSDSVSEDRANLNEIITFLTGHSLTAEESDRYESEGLDYLRDNFIGYSYG